MLTDVLQAVANGLLSGALIAVPAIGFTTIFAVLRFPDFAIAAYATIGAFAGWWVNTRLGLGVFPILVAAFVAAALIGALAEHVALKPLRPAGALTTAIGSIALNLVLENAVRFVFGSDLRGYDLPLEQDITLGGIRVGPQQVEDLGLAVFVLVCVFAFLRFSRFGRAMRAVADNPDLARLKGIDPARIAVAAIMLGAGLAGVGGVLIGFDTSIDPLTGYRVLLDVFAAAVLGGLGSIQGAVVGALVLGVAEEVALLGVPPTYRGAIGFVAILVVLSVRPRGMLGERAALMLNYLIATLVSGGIFAVLALSLNLAWGGAGMVNLGLAGFFAVGAYTSALITGMGAPFVAGLAAAVAMGAVTGLAVTLLTLRLRDDYLAIVTLGFAELVRLVAVNERWLTKGADGLSGILAPLKSTLGLHGFAYFYLGLTTAIVAAVGLGLRRLDASPYGRALRAVREDPDLARFAGKDVLRFKLQAFALSAAIAALAGALYAHFQSYISPDLFAPLITIYIFLGVTAGGVGRPMGAVLGGYAVLGFLEAARFTVGALPWLEPAQLAAVQGMLTGLALLIVLRFRPQGVLPERIRAAPR